ncbi:MAG: hypothetical protein K2N30_04585 [Clostridia bacterium]|nr:hypothetical protein [Clostridia bacterium]
MQNSQNLTSELNAYYRGEYEEATKRLHNVTKLLASLLVAISGILAAAVATFVPACTCNNYSVQTCELILFLMNVSCSVLAFVADLSGLISLGYERLFMSYGKIKSYGMGIKPDKHYSENEKVDFEIAEVENGVLDLSEYYSDKIKHANTINIKKQNHLQIASIATLFSVLLLIGLIIACIV